LLIDPACSIVFEAEPEASDIMTRPPRKLMDSPFAFSSLLYPILQGIAVAEVLLLGYWLMAGQGFQAAEIRGAMFMGLVLGLCLLILANRNVARSLLHGLTASNPWIWRMFGAVILLLGVVFSVPVLRDIMGFSIMGVPQLVAGVALVLGIGVCLEVLRWVSGHVRHGVSSPVIP
jgi:Ca2+-transporting ATPase